MGDLYASAISTTVLQLTEIPPRPVEFDGTLCLFDLKVGVDENAILVALREFGSIASCKLSEWPPATVRFTTHAAALAAKQAAARLSFIAGGIDTLYNERSYDGREGEGGDRGRGW